MTNLACASVISRVVVHARGALVTREVALPDDLPPGTIDVDVPGVTILAEPGSARVELLEGDRIASAVHGTVVVPQGELRPGPTLERVRDLAARLERLADEHRVLNERRSRLETLPVAPTLRTEDRRRARDALDVRFAEAQQVAALLKEKTDALDARILSLEGERRGLARALEAARLEDRQASTPDRFDQPTRTFTTRLVGEGRAGRLLLTYAVRGARWWPSYTLRIGGAATGGERDGAAETATWLFEALVAQRTGEDWSGITLALSSADLVFDARLPELASLRFGRAQPLARRPFRPAPQGVDGMFDSYLASGGAEGTRAEEESAGHDGAAYDTAAELAPDEEEREDTVVEAMKMRKRSVPPALGGASPMGMAVPAPARPAFAAMPRAAPRGGFAPQMIMSRAMDSLASFGGGGPAAASSGMPFAEEAPELVPSESWNDHDALVLVGPGDPRRGRLVPRPAAGQGGRIARAENSVEQAADARLVDPIDSRGMFDHRYDAEGRADVPSDARVHRVAVDTQSSELRLEWRAVPSEALDVHREAKLVNPFGVGLLGGPVDVYLEGSLLTTTTIDRIDRGGSLSVGMGVDDRFKIARNVRSSEESFGLLGGSTAVTHTVDIEVSAALSRPVPVTVLERVPVTDDKAIEIKVVKASPSPQPYDQADRGEPVRGGQRFVVTVGSEKKTTIELVYRLVFAQKLDIVGGSRRG